MNHAFIVVALVIASLTGCAQRSSMPEDTSAADALAARPTIEPVGSVSLITAQMRAPSLASDTLGTRVDIGIVPFTTRENAVNKAAFGDWIFDEIKQKETQFLPHLLSKALIESDLWGAVRVLPEADPSLVLTIRGEIISSNGLDLAVHINATDSSGRVWLARDYADVAQLSDYPESTRFTYGNRFDGENYVDPFHDLYKQVANDLLATRDGLDDGLLAETLQIADLVYARDLAPERFASKLTEDEEGLLRLVTLPAANDPMLARVSDMRYRHHLFIDTVDEYYQTLYEDIQPAYVLWRRYSLDQTEETLSREATPLSTTTYGDSRSFLALSQRYDRFKWSKIYEHEFTELAAGFNNELAPAMLALNGQVHGLSGTMEQQYREWRGILRALFELETTPLSERDLEE
jgi:hypothetical protein